MVDSPEGPRTSEVARGAPEAAPIVRSRRLIWPVGLSARLLLLTALFVLITELFILLPSLASFEDGWLIDRVRAAELASLAVEAAPAGVVSDQLSGRLLKGAGVVSVAVQSEGSRRLLLAAPHRKQPPSLIDLRQQNAADFLAEPFRALGPDAPPMLRVEARPQFRSGDFIEIVVPSAPLTPALQTYLVRTLLVSVLVSLVAGIGVYLLLAAFLVRPIRRITVSMERFRARPDDPAARLSPSGRRDEIGRAEAELSRMQEDLLVALQSRARLAALGEAVAKINHDLRNMLTSAQMASDRLATSGDPKVAQALPRLERALDRAVRLAQHVLDYGKSDEAPPQMASVLLASAAEAAGEDAGLSLDGVRLKVEAPKRLRVEADPDQLHRMLVNLFRNARQALEAAEPKREGVIRFSAEASEAATEIRIADNGPGVPERVQAALFQPFMGSGRPGGAGLGLAIARDLARGHGGDLQLLQSSAEGAVFLLTLPIAPKATEDGARR
jgi:signal transduction histidine kinase